MKRRIAWQHSIRRALNRRARLALGKTVETDAKRIEDFGLWGDPDTALEQFDVLRAWNILPREGGWEGQSEHFRENMVLLLNLYAEETDAVMAEGERGRSPIPKRKPKPPEVVDVPPAQSKTMRRLFGK